MQIRLWTKEDIEDLSRAEELVFKTPWTYSMLLQEYDNPLFTMYVVYDGNVLSGYIGYYVIAGEVHIANLAVLPKYRGKGIAKSLIAKTVNDAISGAMQAMTLEVRASNTAAITLYGSFGFTVKGLRKKYYENTEDAYIMWKYFYQ